MKRLVSWISKDKKIQKSISFRIVATVGTFACAYVFTGNPFISLPIAGAQALTNTTIYYFHEGYCDKENEPKEPKQPKMQEHWKKYGVD